MLDIDINYMFEQTIKEDTFDKGDLFPLAKVLEWMCDLNYGRSFIIKQELQKEKFKEIQQKNKIRLREYSLDCPNLKIIRSNDLVSLETIARKNMLDESKRRTKASHENRNK